MRTRTTILLFGICSLLSAQRYQPPVHDYPLQERYNDSLFIYNTFATQIETLKKLKESDLPAWREREARDNALIACALIRLKAYNKTDYLPDDDHNRKQGGTALHYPAPSKKEHRAYFEKSGYLFRYSITDHQTHLMYDSAGVKRIPYVVRYHFDHERIISKDTLNPVTLEPLH